MRSSLFAGLAAALLASSSAFAGTETSSAAWALPPEPAPAPEAPLPESSVGPTVRPDVSFRVQGGFNSGVVEGSGAGIGLTGAARWSAFSAEVSGRYRTPREVAFPSGTFFARVSLFEIAGRGCFAFDVGEVEVPLCLGASGGRYGVDPAEGTPATPSAKLWVGAHASLAARYRMTPTWGLWLGVEGTASVVRPEVELDPDRAPGADPLQAGAFGVALELGVELDPA